MELASAWFYGVLRDIVKTPTGEQIVRNYLQLQHIPTIMDEIHQDAKRSTHAIVNLRDLYLSIVTMRLDSTWRKSLSAFLLLFEDRVRDYNTRVPDGEKISETMAKVHLRTAVSTCRPLNDVQVRESEMMVMTGQEYTYQQYLQVLRHQATLTDTKNTPQRSVNVTEWQESQTPEEADEEESYQVNQSLSEYIVNAAASERNLSRMARSTWRSLTPEAQKIWDQLDDDNKAKILKSSSGKPTKRSQNNNRKVQANIAEQEPSEVDEAGDTADETCGAQDTDTIEVNKTDAVSKAKEEAHPGDARKMLSSKGNTNREVNSVQFQSFNVNYDRAVRLVESDSSYGLVTGGTYGLSKSPKEWHSDRTSTYVDDDAGAGAYGLSGSPREWHDTRQTLVRVG